MVFDLVQIINWYQVVFKATQNSVNVRLAHAQLRLAHEQLWLGFYTLLIMDADPNLNWSMQIRWDVAGALCIYQHIIKI